jgi:hypothetical protein
MRLQFLSTAYRHLFVAMKFANALFENTYGTGVRQPKNTGGGILLDQI